MNENDQRIAIAEACGWHKGGMPDGWIKDASHYAFDVSALPDYLHDLNAMHEAEEMLCQDEEDEDTWAETLRTVSSSFRDSLAGNAKAMHATAAQRAQAFLRVLGKWTETK